MNKKKAVFRGVRKGAYLTRKVTSKAANFSGRIENKAGRIINGTDPTIQIHQKILQEQIIAEALPEITPLHPAMPFPGRKATVSLLIPSLQNSSFFGGTATALIVAAELAQQKKMPLRILETLKHGKATSEQLAEFLNSQGFSIRAGAISLVDVAGRKYNHYGYVDLHPDDIFIASAWWDAHLLNQLPLLKKFIYLIQDFEPIFYNNSDRYVLAEETYRNNSFVPLFNTQLMQEFVTSRGYEGIPKKALFFEPAVNIGKHIGYSESKSAEQKKRLFIYGRPGVDRNLFYRALDVTDKAFSDSILVPEEWEVYMAGQDKLPNILLDSGVTVQNLGKLSLDEYHEFAKTIDLGLSLMMAPHPSYPPLELASLGAAIVTTNYSNKQDLANYSKNIITTGSSLPALLDGIRSALAIPHATRLKNAQSMSLPSNWHEALDATIQDISRIL